MPRACREGSPRVDRLAMHSDAGMAQETWGARGLVGGTALRTVVARPWRPFAHRFDTRAVPVTPALLRRLAVPNVTDTVGLDRLPQQNADRRVSLRGLLVQAMVLEKKHLQSLHRFFQGMLVEDGVHFSGAQ